MTNLTTALPDAELRIEVDRDGPTVRMRASGELDLLSAPGLLDAVDAVCADGPACLEVDLRAVSFLDSSGAAPLRHARDLLAERGALVVRVTGRLHQMVLATAGVGSVPD